ncbi:hypothetical protein VTG60DRAFT_2005 [Thermothelomyces hinnuleus]
MASIASSSAPSMALPAAQDAAATLPTDPARNFMDLPQEVQREIFRQCSNKDLICLATVSRHFRDLAAAELYRDFKIVFPEGNRRPEDTYFDPLALGLDTFATSDYNYARYLRRMTFDTVTLDSTAAVSYRPYHSTLSCGKFMNTLLLLALRKAQSLESFKWNIGVELSRPVYKELHQIPALSHVHIRLQTLPSRYQSTSSPTFSASNSTSSPASVHVAPIPSVPPPLPPPVFAFGTQGPSDGVFGSSSVPPGPSSGLKQARSRSTRKGFLNREHSTLSGFKGLKSLAVLDIDNLDIVPELQSAIQNSAGTLSELKLSFSEKLASAARNHQANVSDSEESDQEDGIMPVPLEDVGMSEQARDFRAQQARKVQETVLARILDVEPTPAKALEAAVVETEKKKKKNKKGEARTEQELVDMIKTIAPKLMGELNGTKEFAASQDITDMIGLAARKYVEEAKSRGEKADQDQNGADGAPSSISEPSDKAAEGVSSEASAPEVSLFGESTASKKPKDHRRVADPDDIDIEEPLEQLAIDAEEPPAGEPPGDETATSANNPEPGKAAAPTVTALADTRTRYGEVLATLKLQKADFKALAEELQTFESQANALGDEIRRWRAANSSANLDSLGDAESQLLRLTRSIRDMQAQISACQSAIECADKSSAGEVGSCKEHARQMRDYIRETRGLALESLSIFLIPTKASVLSKAVDLRVLRRLTLLNVGIQAPIWALLHKENKEAPLPLREVFTDNVSVSFLNCIASLEEVRELLMLERDPSEKPESFAPRTQTTMDQIRRIVLRKHAPTIRNLMIKNLADATWDVDEKTVLLLSRHGKRLEELACNMNVRTMHCFAQHINAFKTLRALHVHHLHNSDTCVWVVRETKRFLVDSISHNPDLKLDWIAIDEDERADRIMRLTEWVKLDTGEWWHKDDLEHGLKEAAEKNKNKKKGKSKHHASSSSSSSSSSSPSSSNPVSAQLASGVGVEDLDVSAIIAAELGENGGDSSGSENGIGDSSDEDGDEFLGQKTSLYQGVMFYEVDDVRIFEKEVVAGRL